MARIQIKTPESTYTFDRIDENVLKTVDEVLDKIVEEYARGETHVSEGGSTHGPFIDGAYRHHRYIASRSYEIDVDYRTTDPDAALASMISDMISRILDEIHELIDEKIEELAKQYGYEVVDADSSEACFDRILYNEKYGYEFSVGWCLEDYRYETGCGFGVGGATIPSLNEILSDIRRQLEEVKRLEELATNYPYVAIAVALRNVYPDNVVKVMKLGNSRAVPVRTIELGKHVKRYVVESGRLECFELVE